MAAERRLVVVRERTVGLWKREARVWRAVVEKASVTAKAAMSIATVLVVRYEGDGVVGCCCCLLVPSGI
jgi:hypothetical protein